MKEFINKAKLGVAAVAGIALMSTAFIAPVNAACDSTQVDNGISGGISSDCAQGKGTPTNLTGDGGIVTTVINTMLFIVGILSVIMIIYAGIRYTTAHGDTKQVEGAKNTLIYAIVGLVVAILAYALVNWVTALFVKS